MKIFISHKKEDALVANEIAKKLEKLNVSYYLDVLDETETKSGKALTEHIRRNLNKCTDIIVIMSTLTRFSQWVPFEVGMAAQIDMPTATFLEEDVEVPDFLQYWPRLKKSTDILKYVMARIQVEQEYQEARGYRMLYETASHQKSKTERFYDVLKQKL